jgi:hypothetical protein
MNKIISYFSFDLPDKSHNLKVYDRITDIVHLLLTFLIIFFASTNSGIAAAFCLAVATLWASRRKNDKMGTIPRIILTIAIAGFFAQLFILFI